MNFPFPLPPPANNAPVSREQQEDRAPKTTCSILLYPSQIPNPKPQASNNTRTPFHLILPPLAFTSPRARSHSQCLSSSCFSSNATSASSYEDICSRSLVSLLVVGPSPFPSFPSPSFSSATAPAAGCARDSKSAVSRPRGSEGGAEGCCVGVCGGRSMFS